MLDNKTLNSGRITTITIYGYNNNHYNLQITRSMLVMFKITIQGDKVVLYDSRTDVLHTLTDH